MEKEILLHIDTLHVLITLRNSISRQAVLRKQVTKSTKRNGNDSVHLLVRILKAKCCPGVDQKAKYQHNFSNNRHSDTNNH